ncbi:5541_t:CDS:2 [Diversispora eburnea]|uniref:5541_t:CDS:1 n=1 Tax=Diversispora eburnea TaxID=1213867 RepID=A0A9N8YN92_9GLOM|nr:5541_t:CDS:2 [Diversispora eburnea]
MCLPRFFTRQVQLFLRPHIKTINANCSIFQQPAQRFHSETNSNSKSCVLAYFITGGFALFISGDNSYSWYVNRCYERRLDETMEKGTRPEIDSSDDACVSRPLVVDQLNKIFQPYKNQSYYYMVCGEPGTGKTKLIKTSANEVGQGVIYVDVPANINLFGDALGKALNYEFDEHVSYSKRLIRKLFGASETTDAFKRCAEKYKNKYGKLPVIVYDNVSRLITVHPEVIDILQDDAKDNADDKKYISVFVCSGGNVPRRMESKKPVIEIGDLNKEESMYYLINERKINVIDATRLYDLVGGRIMELKNVADDFLAGQTFDVIKQQIFGTIYDDFEMAEMNPSQSNHEAAKTVIRALSNSNDMLHVSMLRELTKVEPNKLLEGNVFAYHPAHKAVTFLSRSVERYVQENATKFIK